MTKRHETFSKFDAADYLKNDADVASYLAAAAEGGDASHFARALGTVARARNLTALARSIAMTRQGLTKAVTGEANPTLDTVMKILTALDMKFGVESAPRKRRSKPVKLSNRAA
jgi:probable addiction module antidote protein